MARSPAENKTTVRTMRKMKEGRDQGSVRSAMMAKLRRIPKLKTTISPMQYATEKTILNCLISNPTLKKLIILIKTTANMFISPQ